MYASDHSTILRFEPGGGRDRLVFRARRTLCRLSGWGLIGLGVFSIVGSLPALRDMPIIVVLGVTAWLIASSTVFFVLGTCLAHADRYVVADRRDQAIRARLRWNRTCEVELPAGARLTLHRLPGRRTEPRVVYLLRLHYPEREGEHRFADLARHADLRSMREVGRGLAAYLRLPYAECDGAEPGPLPAVAPHPHAGDVATAA